MVTTATKLLIPKKAPSAPIGSDGAFTSMIGAWFEPASPIGRRYRAGLTKPTGPLAWRKRCSFTKASTPANKGVDRLVPPADCSQYSVVGESWVHPGSTGGVEMV